jgi:hypothetical protein
MTYRSGFDSGQGGMFALGQETEPRSVVRGDLRLKQRLELRKTEAWQ